jgi:hypothetical protein
MATGGGFRRLRRPAAVLAVLVIGAECAHAGRPLETEDTVTVPPGHGELELGVDYARRHGVERGVAAGILTIGLLPRLDGALQLGAATYDDPDAPTRGGLADGLVTFKWLLAAETDVRPAVLFSPAARLPIGSTSRQLGLPRTDVQLLLAASKTLGPVTVTGNAGRTFVTWDRGLDHWRVSASAVYALTSTWAPVAEAVGLVGAPDADDAALLRAGTIYRATGRLALDAAAAVGVAGVAPDFTATVGLTWLFF